jgi:hypothetical protein
MAFGAVAVGLLLAGLAGEALAETIREVQIGDTVVAYDADRFRVTSHGADSLEVNCKSGDCSPGIGIFAERSACGDPSRAIYTSISILTSYYNVYKLPLQAACK